MLQGITKVCCELLDLKDAVENMCGDMHIKYLTFLRMLLRPRARTILVDGDLREGEPLIPLPSFEILVLLTFSSPSTGVKSTEKVEALYPLLKDVAFSQDMPFAPEKVVFHLLTNAMKSWFAMNMDNLRGVTAEVQKFEYFKWLNASYVPVLKQLQDSNMQSYYFSGHNDDGRAPIKFRNPKLMNRETSSFEIPLIAASISFGSLDHLNPQYSPAATCVFFDVARTFSKSNCDIGLGT
ncbi:hypothetical protein Bca4012_031989 [Brassica carinata]|uniref:Uncharacterized protein n=1 Tax=Brassica oleracea TaxID=3712 RepID=A0A3P6BWH1_BRAOL|nr:unnamed protein product [Brassica oleracea]